MPITQKKVVCLNAQTEHFNSFSTTNNLDIVLQDNGFEIVHTPQEKEGIHAVYRETPDVVLLDMSENKSSVWDLYQQIRKSALTCNIPVILITGKTSRIEDILKIYAANAADCLIKPFAPQELVISINQVLLN